MTEFSLVPHPNLPHPEVAIDVEAARTPEGTFVLRYVATGEIDNIKVPEPLTYASRRDNLWQTTCFEAFVRPDATPTYVEFNFAPSTGWAAYHFSAYRERQDLFAFPSPHFDVQIEPGRLIVTVALDTTEGSLLSSNTQWALGLTAVIEAKDGAKSYWALAHAPGKPDFHNADCFTARLAAPDRA
jgi:hypothetical protein